MAERYIPEHRRTQFKAKNTFKPDELRRRREEQQVEIRKQKREENLAKRRGITARDGSQTSAPGASLGAAPDSDDEGGTIESQVRFTIYYLPFDSWVLSYVHLLLHGVKYNQAFRSPLGRFDKGHISVEAKYCQPSTLSLKFTRSIRHANYVCHIAQC